MKTIMKTFGSAVLTALTVSPGAMAQSLYYDDLGCRQYADAQIAPLRDQANSQAIGSTILGAGFGAALGAAVGGGRGAGIGAASGAIVGTGGRRRQCPERSGIPATAVQRVLYAMHGGSEISAGAIFRNGAGLCAGAWLCPAAELSAAGIVGNTTSNDLNRQELNRLNGPPSYPWPQRY
jgi:outer membrane lipoprotein SlyB